MASSFVKHHPVPVQEPLAAAALVALNGLVAAFAFLGSLDELWWRHVGFFIASELPGPVVTLSLQQLHFIIIN